MPGRELPRSSAGESATVSGRREGDEIPSRPRLVRAVIQHEYDHLNGFCTPTGSTTSGARRPRKAVKKAGWGKPGGSWMPGVDPDPFGHDTPDDHDL